MLIGIAAFWAYYVFNRLWQEQLARDAQGALRAAEARGLVLLPAGWGAALVAVGPWAGRSLRVEWRAGLAGPRSRVRWGDQRWVGPLLRSERELVELLPVPDDQASELS